MTASFYRKAAAFLLGILLLSSSLSAQLITASGAGYYTSDGDHDSSNTFYIAGASGLEVRSFFVFNLPVFTQPIVSAKMEIFNNAAGEPWFVPGYLSGDATETLSLFKVSTPVSTLLANATGAVSIFNDLGNDPTPYGSLSVSSANDGSYVTFSTVTSTLSASFLSDLNGASGNAFAIGAAITSISDVTGFESIFSASDLTSANPAVRLTLVPSSAPVTAVPEPAMYGFTCAAFLGLLVLRRRAVRTIVRR
jgi:hypothetical protein